VYAPHGSVHLPAPSSSHQLVLPAALGRVFKGSVIQVKVCAAMASYSFCTAQQLSAKKISQMSLLTEDACLKPPFQKTHVSLHGYRFLERSP